MPPLPPVTDPSVIKVEWKTGDGASIEAGSRVFFAYSGAAPSVADLNTLAAAVSSAWGSHIAARVANTESLHGVTITDLSSDTGSVGVWEGTVAGTNEGESTTAGVAAVVLHQITRRYRGGRPKTFVRAGTIVDLATTNTWTDTFVTDMLEAWEAFIAEIIATTGVGITSLSIVNVSYYSGFTSVLNPITGRTRDVPKLRTDGPVTDSIVVSTVASKLGTQRRRLNL